MKHLKFFEKFRNATDINLLLDVSGSISENMIKSIIHDIYLSGVEYDKINLIQFTTEVVDFSVITNINDIKISKKGGGGTIIQTAIDFVIDNGLNIYKTYIVSDFYADEPNYSLLSDYELLTIDDYADE